MTAIRVVVQGAYGKMGLETVGAVCGDDGMELVGAVSRRGRPGDVYALPDGSGEVPLSDSVADVLSDADVVVDFTNAEGAMSAIRAATAGGANVVTGSTGLSEAQLEEAGRLAEDSGRCVIVAPNFALGAVLLIHLAGVAAPFFDYADLTEVHHEAKLDAPSGTALAIARAAAAARGEPFVAPAAETETLAGTRGGTLDGVVIHSGRMTGRVAHHELVFGALGQTLTLRHDSINRESFMPGVLLAIRRSTEMTGLTVGLENLLGLA